MSFPVDRPSPELLGNLWAKSNGYHFNRIDYWVPLSIKLMHIHTVNLTMMIYEANKICYQLLKCANYFITIPVLNHKLFKLITKIEKIKCLKKKKKKKGGGEGTGRPLEHRAKVAQVHLTAPSNRPVQEGEKKFNNL